MATVLESCAPSQELLWLQPSPWLAIHLRDKQARFRFVSKHSRHGIPSRSEAPLPRAVSHSPYCLASGPALYLDSTAQA